MSAFAGTHRVQRVPVNEKNGRRHSSQIVVIVFDPIAPVLPQWADKEIRVDTFRASGAGGQHRNKTDSAVRLTHLPSGIVVTATEERSQHQNRAVAIQRLQTKLGSNEENGRHEKMNTIRHQTKTLPPQWVWCGWRDEVKGPHGRTHSMERALKGRLSKLL